MFYLSFYFILASGARARDLAARSFFSSLLLLIVLLLRLLCHFLSVSIFFLPVLPLLLLHLLLVSPWTRRTDREIQRLILIKENKHKIKLNSYQLHTCTPFSSHRDLGVGLGFTGRLPRCELFTSAIIMSESKDMFLFKNQWTLVIPKKIENQQTLKVYP